MRLNEIYEKYRGQVDFYCVYIQEAHPSNGWQVRMNIDDDVLYEQPTEFEEREALASTCALRLNLDLPMLPERLYVLDHQGAVQFRTVVGSPGFDVDAWEQAVATIADARKD
mgnify:CR=1 FL=1